MKRWLAIAVGSTTLACAPRPAPRTCQPRPVSLSPSVAEVVAHPGQASELRFSWDTARSCVGGGDTPQVTRVDVELLDPDNLPLEALPSPPVQRITPYKSEAWDVSVYFTPRKIGPHHVLVTFDPEGGLVQRDFWVAADRSNDTAVWEDTPSTQCTRIAHTRAGSLVCENATGVLLFRAGVEVTRWPGATVRVAGDALWLRLNSAELARVVELPGGALDELRGRVGVGQAWAAKEKLVLSWNGAGVDRIGLDAGVPELQDQLTGPGLEVSALAFDLDAGTAIAATFLQWGRFPFEGAQDLSATRWTGDQALLQAPDGLWLVSAGGALRFAPADLRQVVTEVIPPLGWKPSPGSAASSEQPLIFPVREYRPDASPIVDRSEALVAWVRDGALQLGHFTAPEGAQLMEVNGPWLRATQGDRHFFFRLNPD